MVCWLAQLSTFRLGPEHYNNRLSQSEINDSNAEASSLFALAWQMMKNILPPEVVADFDDFVAGTGIPRMNGNGQSTYQRHISSFNWW